MFTQVDAGLESEAEFLAVPERRTQLSSTRACVAWNSAAGSVSHVLLVLCHVAQRRRMLGIVNDFETYQQTAAWLNLLVSPLFFLECNGVMREFDYKYEQHCCFRSGDAIEKQPQHDKPDHKEGGH